MLVCNRQSPGITDRWLVGWGMVPRGEVGLIFAFVGKSIGVVNDALFSVIVFMVIATTLVTPPELAWLLRRPNGRQVVPVPAVQGADGLRRRRAAPMGRAPDGARRTKAVGGEK